jgi:hypothetical protein
MGSRALDLALAGRAGRPPQVVRIHAEVVLRDSTAARTPPAAPIPATRQARDGAAAFEPTRGATTGREG